MEIWLRGLYIWFDIKPCVATIFEEERKMKTDLDSLLSNHVRPYSLQINSPAILVSKLH